MPKPKDICSSRKVKRKINSRTKVKCKHNSSLGKQNRYNTLKRKHSVDEQNLRYKKKKSRKNSSSSSSSSTSLSSSSTTSSSSSSSSTSSLSSSSSVSSLSSSSTSSLNSSSSTSSRQRNYSFDSSHNDSERMDAYYPYSVLQFSDRLQYSSSSPPSISQQSASTPPQPRLSMSPTAHLAVLPSTSRSQTAPPHLRPSPGQHVDSSRKDEMLHSCPICMDKFRNNAVASTMCGHIFCLKCIKLALKRSKNVCPTCRKKLNGVGYHQLFL